MKLEECGLRMQRVASSSEVLDDGNVLTSEEPLEVHDMTPRWVRCLPSCLQSIGGICFCFVFLLVYFPLFGCLFFLLSGPFVFLSIVCVVPFRRKMFDEYAENSDIVVGRVVERIKSVYKFFSTTGERHEVVVEYYVDSSTFRKTFRVSKSDYDGDEFTMDSTMELLVIHDKPKSAMRKESLERCIEKLLGPLIGWWKMILSLFQCVFAPMLIIDLWSPQMSDRETLERVCILGVISFALTALGFWWWDPVTKEAKYFLESAEQVRGDEETTEDATRSNNRDSLIVPLLSAVTGV